MNLTVLDIQADIEGFQARIADARAGLKELPAGRLPYSEHKKREKLRRDCKAEIEHVKQLITYAFEGIAIRQADNGGKA